MKFRAEGEQQARGLRSKADGDSQVIQAEAEREALRLRGEGDAEAAQIYARGLLGRPRVLRVRAQPRGVPEVARRRRPRWCCRADSSFLKYLFDMGGANEATGLKPGAVTPGCGGSAGSRAPARRA